MRPTAPWFQPLTETEYTQLLALFAKATGISLLRPPKLAEQYPARWLEEFFVSTTRAFLAMADNPPRGPNAAEDFYFDTRTRRFVNAKTGQVL